MIKSFTNTGHLTAFVICPLPTCVSPCSVECTIQLYVSMILSWYGGFGAPGITFNVLKNSSAADCNAMTLSSVINCPQTTPVISSLHLGGTNGEQGPSSFWKVLA